MISVIIPNFNGEKLLKKNLPKVLATNPDEIIVVDDASSDNSVAYIKKQIAKRKSTKLAKPNPKGTQKLKIIENKKNLGFVKSVNRGVQEAVGEIIVLLNNDVAPTKNFLKPILPYFKNQKIFAVSFCEPQFSWAKAAFINGFIVHGLGERQDKPYISFWASGGSAAFSRELWEKLGGMDPVYHPFYWEDIDLSYRAAKRGWEIWWEPAAVVYHVHGETIEKYFSKSFRDYITARNQLLFIWKNITSKKLIWQHQKELAKRLLKGQFWRPFLGALLKLPDVFEKRKREGLEEKLKDEEIFAKFS